MKDILFCVSYIKTIAENTLEIRLESSEKLPQMRGGQFIHLQVPGGDTLLRRPFCLYKFDETSVTLIVAIVGKGTKALGQVRKGDKLLGIVPVGNGFILEEKHKKIVLIGGGIGCAPLLGVPVSYPDKEYYTYLGFSCGKDVLFDDEFEKVSTLKLCTDDGSCGICGYPTDALAADIEKIKPDVILTCGSLPLLKAVARVSHSANVPAYMTGEARMGCGVGACLVCTCGVRDKDGIVRNKRACVDGPVFNLEDIVL